MLIFNKESTVCNFLYWACICLRKSSNGFAVHSKSALFSLLELSPASEAFVLDSWALESAGDSISTRGDKWTKFHLIEIVFGTKEPVSVSVLKLCIDSAWPTGRKARFGLKVKHSHTNTLDFCHLDVTWDPRIGFDLGVGLFAPQKHLDVGVFLWAEALAAWWSAWSAVLPLLPWWSLSGAPLPRGCHELSQNS